MTIILFLYYRIFPLALLLTAMLTLSVGATYEQFGTADNNYFTGQGLFDENRITSITGTANVGTDTHIPLVADLDGNGDNEIVFLNGDSLIIYKNITLSPVTSITLGNLSSLNHMILFDIDGDSDIEIIIASNSSFIQSYSFNGTTLTKEFQVGLDGSLDSPSFIGNGEVVIQCLEANRCLAVYPERGTADGGNALYAMGFDGSGGNGTSILLQDTSGGKGISLFCFARQKNIAINQKAGDDNFVVSNAHWNAGDGTELFVYGVAVDGALVSTLQYEREITDYSPIPGTPTISGTCDEVSSNEDKPQNTFTSPLSMDVQNAGDHEIVIGYMTSGETFKMKTLDSAGTVLSSYPSLQTAEGNIVSNVMRGKVFDNGNFDDFCVMGYDAPGNRLDMLCGSEKGNTPSLATSEEFFYNFGGDGFINMTDAYNSQTNIVHFGEHATDDVSEPITSFGIFEIDYTTQAFGATPGVNSKIDIIHTFSVQNSSVIPVDVELNGNVDMLQLTPLNLLYLNDGFLNSPGQISTVTFTPCPIGTVIAVNTTMNIVISIVDPDNDNVRGGATVYFGDSNAQTQNQTQYVGSGGLISFTYQINKSINGGIIQIFGNDIENNNTIDFQTQSFTVDTVGITGAQTSCTSEFNVTAADEDAQIPEGEDDAVNQIVDEVEELTGMDANIIWLIFMAAVGTATMAGLSIKNIHGSAALGSVVIEQIALLVVGVLFGFISVGLVVILAVLSAIVFGLWFATMSTGGRLNN